MRDSDSHSACGKALEQGAWRGGAISTLQESQNLTGFFLCFLVLNSKAFNRLLFAACGAQQCRTAPHLWAERGQCSPLCSWVLERGRRFQKLKQPLPLFKRERKTCCICFLHRGNDVWVRHLNELMG